MHLHKVSVSLRKGIFHKMASIPYVMKFQELLIKKNSKVDGKVGKIK